MNPNTQQNKTTRKLSMITLAALLVLGAVSWQTYQSVFGNTTINETITSNPDLEDGLVSHWTFDGPDMIDNVADRSGNNNDGLLTNFTATTTVDGKIGQALEFDGVDDYVEATDGAGNSTSTVGTISAWIKLDEIGVQRETIYAMKTSHSYRGLALFIYTDGTVGRFFKNGASTIYDYGTATLTAGSWHHVALTYDGTNTTVYIDGESEVIDAVANRWFDDISNAYNSDRIGDGEFTGQALNPFNGSLDDVRLYDRELSQEEISRLYDRSATTYINKSINTNPDLESGLVGHWTFDGPDITTQILDRSGSGNHGGFIGGATTSAAVVGKIGQGLQFDGVDDWVHAGDLDLQEHTVVAWIYMSSAAAKVVHPIVSIGYSSCCGTEIGTTISWNGGGGRWQISHLQMAGITFSKNMSDSHLDRWLHVVGKWDGSTRYIYLDGEVFATTSESDAITELNDCTSIGGSINGCASAAAFFDGTIDDVRVYNRALSADEISRLYDLGATTYINKTITTNPNLKNGLVGHWTFDGPDMDLSSSTAEVLDRSGNGNNGDWLNHATTTTFGKVGQALLLDGVDDHIDVGKPASLQSLDSFTASAWIKVSSARGVSIDYILGQYGGFTIANGDILFYVDASEQIIIWADRQGGVPLLTSSAITENEYHHVVVTVDGNSKAVMYIDGVVDDTNTSFESTSPYFHAPENVVIGAFDTGSNPFQGLLDDVRIYNRALSEEEVTRLYELGN
ncbi:MAG: hypothetical protein ACI9VM_000265 [Candidatus Azotimanducaceae bacterium]|jgi:hypothetical protein